MLFLLIWFGFAILSAIAAKTRGRSPAAWFALGLLFSVFSLLAVLIMPRVAPGIAPGIAAPPKAPPASDGETRWVVKNHRGVTVERDGDRFLALGRSFGSLDLAEEHIDAAAQTSPAHDPGDAVARLLGNGLFDQVAVGTAAFQPALSALASRTGQRKCIVALTPEPRNPDDPMAVCLRHGDTPLGYLPRDEARDFHDDMARLGLAGRPAEAWARVVGGDTDRPTRGIRLDIAWPLQRCDDA